MAVPEEGEEYGRELLEIPPDKLEKNPENPRLLFPQKELDALAESIKEVGILVPLIVYPKEGEEGYYVILDGERRWRCAIKLNLPTVPCHIISQPTPVENILRMFNIHNVREDWELMPTALKLGKLIDLTGTRNRDKLARLTGLTKANIDRCKKLLTFDEKYQQMVLDGEVKADFFIEMYPILTLLERHHKDLYNRRGRNGLIDFFLQKEEAGAIKAVTDFRYISKLIRGRSKGIPRQRIQRILRGLLRNVEQSVEATYTQTVEATFEAADLVKQSEKFSEALSELDPSEASELEAKRLFHTLTRLREQINGILRTLGRWME